LFKESVEYNLHKLLGDGKGKTVTGSAFSQARYKISPGFFRALSSQVKAAYDLSNKRMWKGHLLIAGDGSTLNLPPSKEIRDYFGAYSRTNDGTNTYLAQVFFFYDVLNNFVLDAQLAKMAEGEKTLLLKSLEVDFAQESIFLLDRGFGHFITIQEFSVRGKDFCIRLPHSSNFAKSILDRHEGDMIVTWTPSNKEKINSKNSGFEALPISLRVVKVILDTGEVELLATSLTDQQNYTKEDIEELYHYRWGVEEGFKNFKPKMKVEQFGTRKPQGIFQEFYAHVFCMNLVGLFGQHADKVIKEKTKHRKLVYQYNWQTAFRFVRERITQWLNGIDIEALIECLIDSISQSMSAVKPNRRFVRDFRNLNRKQTVSQFYK
jgi:hypothetical protein